MAEVLKPPANLEAEQQLLGAIMLDNSHYWQVATFLKPEDFYVEIHEDMFSNMGKLIQAGKQANPITLIPTMPERIGKLTAKQYTLGLFKDRTAAINIEDYAKTISDLNARRRLIQASEETIYEANTAAIDVTAAEIVNHADSRMTEVRNTLLVDELHNQHIDDITAANLQRMYDIRAGNAPEMPSTGYRDLDDHIGGYVRQRFYVLGGRPGSGKTALAAASMRKVVRQKKSDGGHFGAMYFSLEVPERDIWSRLIAAECATSHTPLEYRKIQSAKFLTSYEVEVVERYANALRKFPIRICDKAALTIAEIEAEARAEKQRMEKLGQSLDVIFIDYMQIIQASGKYKGQKVNEIGEISTGCLNMARRLDVAVVATAQLSRAVESREDKRPIMPDLRESGQIEQDANSIIFLYRPAYYDRRLLDQTPEDKKQEIAEEIEARKNDLWLLVEKARDGMPGKVKTYCEIGLNRIDSAF